MSLCFYDNSECFEEKNTLIKYISENGIKNKFMCCKNCIKNKIPSKIVISSHDKELQEKRCPNCKINILEILDTSKIGCPLCYSFFYKEIKILVANCQNFNYENCGKCPDGMHHKSALVACLMKDLEQITNNQTTEELKEYLKNY